MLLLPPGPPIHALPAHSTSSRDVIHCLDALRFLEALPSNSVNCIVTSPPYWGLRDYQIAGQIGLEDNPQAFVERMVVLFREVRRVLRDDGTCWINLGDSYAASGRGGGGGALNDGDMGVKVTLANNHRIPPDGLKPKDLCGIPWRVAFALQADGWYLRSAAPWVKGSAMPESMTDRATTAHEYVFQFSKSAQYWFDAEAVRKGSSTHSHGGGQAHNGRYMQLSGRNDGNQAMGIVTATRNRRTSDTFYEHLDAQIAHWQYVRDNGGVLVGENTLDAFLVNPKGFDQAHFATYPMALIDPCVKAGCPPQVCVECGAPWERVVEKTFVGSLRGKNHTGDLKEGRHSWPHHYEIPSTLGWRPTCDCHAESRPGIVLDPFMGAGTTALVAIQNNRHYIGSELNPEYVEMARQRIAAFDPFQPVEVEDGITQLSLFGA